MIEVKQIDTEKIKFLIEELERFEKGKAIEKALRAGGNLIQSQGMKNLKDRIKDHTGNLKRSFKVRVKKNNRGVLIGFVKGKDGGNHAHLVDRGTKDREHPITGSSGKMPANYFWTDAETSTRQNAVDKILVGIADEVKRINNCQK